MNALTLTRRLPAADQKLRELVLGFDPRPLMQRAIAAGVVKSSPARPALSKSRATNARTRAKRKDASQNQATGAARKTRSHPELHGLKRKAYRRAWMKKRRARA